MKNKSQAGVVYMEKRSLRAEETRPLEHFSHLDVHFVRIRQRSARSLKHGAAVRRCCWLRLSRMRFMYNYEFYETTI